MNCWTLAMSEHKNLSIDHYNDLFLVREQTVDRIFSDHTSINRFVVSEAILKCLRLIETCHGKDSKLYACNTDGIFRTNPKIKPKNKKDVKFDTSKIGKAYTTDSELYYVGKHYIQNADMSDYQKENGNGCVFNGQAGSGKTERLYQNAKIHWCSRSQTRLLKT